MKPRDKALSLKLTQNAVTSSLLCDFISYLISMANIIVMFHTIFYLNDYIIYSLPLLLHVCICGWAYIPQRVYGGQRTTFWSLFSSSMSPWVSGIELKSTGFPGKVFIH